MTENKNHWYDGWFYDRIIAPNQDYALLLKLKAGDQLISWLFWQNKESFINHIAGY